MFWKQYKIHILGTLGNVHTFISCFEKTAGTAVKYAPHLRKQGTKRGVEFARFFFCVNRGCLGIGGRP